MPGGKKPGLQGVRVRNLFVLEKKDRKKMAYRLVAQEQCVCCCDLDKTDGSAGIHAECIAFGVVAAPIGGGKSTTMADIRREIESSREDVSKVIKEEAFKDTIKRLKIDHDGSTPFDVVVDDNDVAYMTLPENVEQWEFLLSCMYKRKNLFEFQLEVQAHLADMVRMSVAAIETVGPITAPLHSRCIYLRKIILIPERSSEDVRLVFLPFDKGAFSKVQYKSMQGMLRCMKELPIFRDASVIYLHVSPQTCFERKTRRDRPR